MINRLLTNNIDDKAFIKNKTSKQNQLKII